MKISCHHRFERRAFALLLVLFTIVSMILVMGSVMEWIASSVNQAKKNEIFTDSQAAAEGATEIAFAQMDRDFIQNGALNSESSYADLLPVMTGWPIQFTFAGTNSSDNPGSISVNIGTQVPQLQALGTEYANLQGYLTPVTVTATAIPTGQLYKVPATVSQTFQFAEVPVFQFAIFYNINLEIDPGATMPIIGAVFSNGGIWSGTANVTYSSSVEAAGQVNTTGTDPFLSTKTDSGTPAANFLEAHQPVSSVDPLEMPIGASTNNSESNVIAILEIPPSSVAAPQSVAYAKTNLIYDFNAASLVVSNWSNGTNSSAPTGNNFQVYLQDVNPSGTSWCAPSTGHRNQLTNDYYVVTNSSGTTIVTSNLFSLLGFTSSDLTNSWGPSAKFLTWKVGTTNWGVKYAGWSFLTNVSFYDYRESKTVQAVEIVVSNLDAWITNNGVNGGSNWNYALTADNGRGIDSVYVYNSVPMTSSQMPAVRVIGGAQLPYNLVVISGTTYTNDGLTVATPQPAYIDGDYNVRLATDSAGSEPGANNLAHTYPAAILADAITVLSDSWKDSYNSSTVLGSRVPTATCFNAACLEGIVQSSTSYPTSGGATGYSGGVENFLRLLEDWSGSIPLTYNGSIIVMFPSQYATNFWQETGNYYNAPERNWSFDTNFENAAGLPPLTPTFSTALRQTWTGN
jgi:hypothetical protein